MSHTDPGTPAGRDALLVDERGGELFLEGHHLGDKRRYGLAFTPAAGTLFKGGPTTYGSVDCFAIP